MCRKFHTHSSFPQKFEHKHHFVTISKHFLKYNHLYFVSGYLYMIVLTLDIIYIEVNTLRIPLYFILSIIIVISGCTTKEITKQDAGQSQVPVKTETVLNKSISNKIELSGLAVPRTQIPLFTVQPLKVQKVHVKVGDPVKENDLLITLNNETATQQLNEANKAVSKLQTALSNAKKSLPSSDQLAQIQQLQKEVDEVLTKTTELLTQIEVGEVSREEILEKSLEVTLKQAQLANATSQLQPFSTASITELEAQLSQANQGVFQAKKMLEATEIRSPIDGVIASLNVVENGQALPNIPLATVIQLNQIDATFQVNSFEVVKLQVEKEVSLTFTGIAESYKGKIDSISPTVNPETNMFTVVIPIQNETSMIKGGMKANATVNINQINEATVIPIDAVLYEDNKPYTYIVEDDQAVRREITTGIRSDQYLQVLSGITPDEQVITEGKERLHNGDSVYVSN
jgi:HlyD family secretion protein